jgi:hypothetical protein
MHRSLMEVFLLVRAILAFGLAALCSAQQPANLQPASQKRIKINVVSGEGAVNNVAMRVASQAVVEVVDDAGAPIEGAEVIFQVPAAGPGGSFFGGMTTQTQRTDAKGRAQMSSFTPNDFYGKFQILVRASAGGATAETIIRQSNGGPNRSGSSASSSSSKKKLAIAAAIIAGAAIAGGVAATRGDGNGTPASTRRPVSIGAGPITVGAPR